MGWMVPLGNSAAWQIWSPYISSVGSASIARSTSCVGNVIRGPETARRARAALSECSRVLLVAIKTAVTRGYGPCAQMIQMNKK